MQSQEPNRHLTGLAQLKYSALQSERAAPFSVAGQLEPWQGSFFLNCFHPPPPPLTENTNPQRVPLEKALTAQLKQKRT